MKKTRAVDLFSSSYDIYADGPDSGADPREVPVGQPGFLGNPFSEGTPEENLIQFKDYFAQRTKSDSRFRKAVLSMYGSRLGCVSEPDELSHGAFIAAWLNAHRRECLAATEPTPEQKHQLGISS